MSVKASTMPVLEARKSPDAMLFMSSMHLLIPSICMFAACIATATQKESHATPEYIAVSIVGGCLYTGTGLLNVLLLRRDARLTPTMVYSNSIMAWSAFFFGPAITYCHIAPLSFLFHYGKWAAVPNFGWGVEWGLQLLDAKSRTSGIRALILMTLSIGSYFLSFAFADPETGFMIIFLPQVAAAIIMCAICLYRYRSIAAGRALAVWVSACACFLVLSAISTDGTFAGETARTLAVQVCDNTQIHFSIRFFVCMFRTKNARETAVLAPSDSIPIGDVESTPQTGVALQRESSALQESRDKACSHSVAGLKVPSGAASKPDAVVVSPAAGPCATRASSSAGSWWR